MADKKYDSDQFVEEVEVSGATVVIPSRRNRKEQREHDRELYKERNLVERFFRNSNNFDVLRLDMKSSAIIRPC